MVALCVSSFAHFIMSSFVFLSILSGVGHVSSYVSNSEHIPQEGVAQICVC